MLTAVLAAVALALPASSAALPAAGGEACDVPHVQYQGDLRTALSLRAVEIVNRAARLQAGGDARLEAMVDPAAFFSLGAGDVGRALGVGSAGARALAREMKADRFRSLGWDGIPMLVEDPCGVQKVEVEFADTPGEAVYPMTFTFKAGRLISASGWSRSVLSGPVERVRD